MGTHDHDTPTRSRLVWRQPLPDASGTGLVKTIAAWCIVLSGCLTMHVGASAAGS